MLNIYRFLNYTFLKNLNFFSKRSKTNNTFSYLISIFLCFCTLNSDSAEAMKGRDNNPFSNSSIQKSQNVSIFGQNQNNNNNNNNLNIFNQAELNEDADRTLHLEEEFKENEGPIVFNNLTDSAFLQEVSGARLDQQVFVNELREALQEQNEFIQQDNENLNANIQNVVNEVRVNQAEMNSLLEQLNEQSTLIQEANNSWSWGWWGFAFFSLAASAGLIYYLYRRWNSNSFSDSNTNLNNTLTQMYKSIQKTRMSNENFLNQLNQVNSNITENNITNPQSPANLNNSSGNNYYFRGFFQGLTAGFFIASLFRFLNSANFTGSWVWHFFKKFRGFWRR